MNRAETNRDWLRKQNEYDLLCKMQANMQNGQEIFCVIYLILGDNSRWITCDETKCKKCIAEWLNMEQEVPKNGKAE